MMFIGKFISLTIFKILGRFTCCLSINWKLCYKGYRIEILYVFAYTPVLEAPILFWWTIIMLISSFTLCLFSTSCHLYKIDLIYFITRSNSCIYYKIDIYVFYHKINPMYFYRFVLMLFYKFDIIPFYNSNFFHKFNLMYFIPNSTVWLFTRSTWCFFLQGRI